MKERGVNNLALPYPITGSDGVLCRNDAGAGALQAIVSPLVRMSSLEVAMQLC
jgi:hypothetical protein